MKVKILGLDPSLSNFGIVKATLDMVDLSIRIDDLVLIETEREGKRKVVRQNSEDLARAKLLHDGLQKHAQGAALVFAEVPVGSQSARAMASYGVCIGVLASCPVPIIQVTPSEVKQIATGHKNATKQEMIEWAVAKYPDAGWFAQKKGGVLRPLNKNEHLADATAAIEAGLATDQFRQVRALHLGTSLFCLGE